MNLFKKIENDIYEETEFPALCCFFLIYFLYDIAMWYQKDWFTGSNYYNLKEKQVHVDELEIMKPLEQEFHTMTEIYYIKQGRASLWINGAKHMIEEGSFFCLYMHHFYKIDEILEPIVCVRVSFHIGLFMFLCFEQHEQNEDEKLMYGVPTVFVLRDKEKRRVLRVLEDLCMEENVDLFLSYNMTIYLTMELHALYCRYAMHRNKKEGTTKSEVWNVIQRVLLDTCKTVPLEEYAKTVHMTPVTLNRQIVKECGYTFFQLQKMGKVYNACALLHFPDLSIQYISDNLGFHTTEDFHRVFKRYMKVSVREYQSKNIGSGYNMQAKEEALQILIYLFLNFDHSLTMEDLERDLLKKAYLIDRRAKEAFGKTIQELLEEIRVHIACSYLVSTDKSITEISTAAGFGSSSSFQRVFFKYMNQTPSAFRDSIAIK